jgi:hypothetical protein
MPVIHWCPGFRVLVTGLANRLRDPLPGRNSHAAEKVRLLPSFAAKRSKATVSATASRPNRDRTLQPLTRFVDTVQSRSAAAESRAQAFTPWG